MLSVLLYFPRLCPKLVESSEDFLGKPKRQLDKYSNIWVYEVS